MLLRNLCKKLEFVHFTLRRKWWCSVALRYFYACQNFYSIWIMWTLWLKDIKRIYVGFLKWNLADYFMCDNLVESGVCFLLFCFLYQKPVKQTFSTMVNIWLWHGGVVRIAQFNLATPGGNIPEIQLLTAYVITFCRII